MKNQQVILLEQQYITIFKLFPVELWFEIFKNLMPLELLKIRLTSSIFNSLVVDLVYKHYRIKIFQKAIEIGDASTLTKVYKHFDAEKDIQTSLRMEYLYIPSLTISKITDFHFAVRNRQLDASKLLHFRDRIRKGDGDGHP